MKKVNLALMGALSVISMGCATMTGVNQTDNSEIPAPPMPAPEGYKWVLNEAYSDEFNGDKLDSEKWHDTYPGWNGRVPGLFVPSGVSVKDGLLQMKCTELKPAQGDKGQWTIGCAAIQTKAQDARFGYYETSLKASSLRTSSTFWLMNPADKAKEVGKRTELDIQECIGNASRWPGFKEEFRNNTHVTYFNKKDKDGKKVSLQAGASTNIGSPVNADFHRYGCWWVDADTMHFYLDGKYVKTIKPSTEIEATPFDQGMYINLVCEIYDWEVLPEYKNLMDDTKNTAYYDYVRAYKLVKK